MTDAKPPVTTPADDANEVPADRLAHPCSKAAAESIAAAKAGTKTSPAGEPR